MTESLGATFFTLQRRDRVVLLPATLVMIVLVALLVGAWAALNWGALNQVFALAQMGVPAQADEAASMRLFSGVMAMAMSAFLFLFPLYMVVAAYEAACLRWMIRSEAPGVFGLVIDNDMWRVYGVYWCWFFVKFAVSLVMGILMMPIMFLTMGDMMNHPDAGPEAMLRWQMSVQLPLSLVQYAPLIFLGIRFGPAAATSIALRRFAFQEAWSVTRGRFGALLGSFAVLWLLIGVGLLLSFGVVYASLLGDVFLRMLSAWPDISIEHAQTIHARVFSVRGMQLIGAGYAISFLLLIIYALLSYGVNAKAALAALAEGRIKENLAP